MALDFELKLDTDPETAKLLRNVTEIKMLIEKELSKALIGVITEVAEKYGKKGLISFLPTLALELSEQLVQTFKEIELTTHQDDKYMRDLLKNFSTRMNERQTTVNFNLTWRK